MNFFEHQDIARRKTGRLILLFVLAVVAIVVSLYFVGVFTFEYMDAQQDHPRPGVELFNPVALAVSVLVSLVIIGGGTLYKLAELRAGGRVIAEHLGGRLLTHETADARGKQLLNVVEEMAIAAGTPVPPVYLLAEEQGINAFAAGYRLEDAVIGVTSGTVQRLTREQMQGVIAHEFSHIVSGDMRINLRLVGVLHGILLLGITGGILLRVVFYSGGGRSRSRDNGKGGGVVVLLIIGAALMAIGYIGTFFGEMIKAAVSRQREFLADASAVQFTRNPDGIAGALRAIGGHRRRGKLVSPRAAEASHMFIAAAIGSSFSTHPPLKERIKRIDPGWDGTFLETQASEVELAYRDEQKRRVRKQLYGDERGRAYADPNHTRHAGSVAGLTGGAGVGLAPDAAGNPAAAHGTGAGAVGAGVGAGVAAGMLGRAGEVSASGVAGAQRLLARIPKPIQAAAREPFSARAVVLALLLDSDEAVRAKQMGRASAVDPVLASELKSIAGAVAELPRDLRLPVIEQAMQPLATLSPSQATRFSGLLGDFIRADEKVDLFEWILHKIVSRRLQVNQGNAMRPATRYFAVGKVAAPLSVLLSAVARAGASSEHEAKAAFEAGRRVVAAAATTFREKGESGLRDLAKALETLDEAAPKVKQQVLAACAATINQDGVVTPTEAELFRAIAETLSVPVPPLYADEGSGGD